MVHGLKKVCVEEEKMKKEVIFGDDIEKIINISLILKDISCLAEGI
jgi:hypothetical protein